MFTTRSHYFELYTHIITHFIRVDVLQFDNDVGNKSFEYHVLLIQSNIHSLVLLPNQSL